MHELKASFVIPAFNEGDNLPATVNALQEVLQQNAIPYEIIIVNDNSTDNTGAVIAELIAADPCIRTIDRDPPSGFGRAIRSGLELVQGDVVFIYMADSSDDPADALMYYRKIEEGFDCVFGSRFRRGSKVTNYPKFKLLVNRMVNRCIQLMFFCPFNDLTNAFKAYRTHVILECGPYRASHFNITIELSLSALVRKYSIAEVPINWYGRTWGNSSLSLGKMGRRYLSTLIKVYGEKLLISDDLITERLANRAKQSSDMNRLQNRISELEEKIDKIEGQNTSQDV